MIYGLTGGFSCGKSSALKIFAEMGYKIFDADKIYSALLQTDVQLQSELSLAIGNSVYCKLDIKKALEENKITFEKLTAITKPYIISAIKNLVSKINYDSVIEVPLLFEYKIENFFDKTICIFLDNETAIIRAQERGYTRAQSEDFILSQINITEKIKRADISIDNNGTIEELKEKIKNKIN